MRNIVILNSLHFSYPLPILMRVSYNTLIVKQNTSDYYKYTKKTGIAKNGGVSSRTGAGLKRTAGPASPPGQAVSRSGLPAHDAAFRGAHEKTARHESRAVVRRRCGNAPCQGSSTNLACTL